MEAKLQNRNELSVNRLEQIDDVEKRLTDIASGKKIFDVIFEWYGIPGIGKTTLTQDLIVKLCEKKSVVFACIDFDSEFNKNAGNYLNDTVLLLEDIVKKFDEQDTFEFTSALYKYQESTNENLKKKRKLKGIKEYVDYVKMLSKDKPIVIIFDTTEKITPYLFAWMEKEIISPISLTGRCIIILTGRFPMRWQKFEVRRLVTSKKLEPLSEKYTFEQVDKIEADIFQFTYGHPLGNKTLSKTVRCFKIKNQAFDERDMVNVMNKVVDTYIMKDISFELNAACRVLSIVRQFDTAILGDLLKKFANKYFQETESFLEINGQLSETSLIDWNSKLEGYVLDENVRYILALYMQINDPFRYIEINKIAADIYRDWIEKVPENKSVYILEYIYHLTNIAIIEHKDKCEIGKKLQQELQDLLEKYCQKNELESDYAATIRLYEELNGDHELKKLVGEENFDRLKKTVNNHQYVIINAE